MIKATATNDEVYTITIGSFCMSGMRKISSWEGMVKLQSEDGETMILDTGSSDIANDLFSKMFNEGMYEDWTVIKISPSLAAKYELGEVENGS